MTNPPGQQWRKFDLHTHTPASKCYRFKNHKPKELIEAAIDKGLDAIAVTDHNSGAWVDQMKEAAKDTNLTIFPGVEISTHENYHVIVLFDVKAGKAEVEGLLAELKFHPNEYGRSEIACKKSIYDIFEVVHKREALIVLAHIDEIKGAFFELTRQDIDETGQTIIHVPAICAQLFDNIGYDAVEVVKGKLPEGFHKSRNIHRQPAFYQSSDNIDPENKTKHSKFGYSTRYTWFSMDQISLEGVRQCFADPEVRIRQMHEVLPKRWPHIMSIKFGKEGFLAYQNFRFHPGLNCVIGHKGTGKSLAIEAIRFALGQASDQADLLKDHIGKIDNRFGLLQTIEAEVMHLNGTVYRITSKNEGDGKATRNCINAETGEAYTGDLSRLFPILAYSQTEVIKIAEDEQAQLRLADALIDARPYQTKIEQIQSELASNNRSLAEALAAKSQLVDYLAERETLQESIKNINRMLDSELLKSMQLAEKKKQVIEQQEGYIDSVNQLVQEFIHNVSNLSVLSIPNEVSDDPALKTGSETLIALKHTVDLALNAMQGEIKNFHSSITDMKEAWLPEFNNLREEYDRNLQGDNSANLEVKRRRLTDELEKIDQAIVQFENQVKVMLPQFLSQRNDLLDQLENAHQEYFAIRNDKFAQLTEASEGKVRLQIFHAKNRDEYAEQLSDLLKGGGPNQVTTSNRQKISSEITPRVLGDIIIEQDTEKLAEKSGLTPDMAERVMQRFWNYDDFDKVLTLQHAYYPKDVPEILFNKGYEYAPIHQLSVGQKCTALLVIALCDGTMPVIIDQPEDALDIASVWDDVARKLRQNKQRRQFILTTHNSSLGVGSDSDTFYVLEPVRGDRAKVAVKGAIDRENVRQAVIDHLEGGDKPYLLKHLKYNVQQ